MRVVNAFLVAIVATPLLACNTVTATSDTSAFAALSRNEHQTAKATRGRKSGHPQAGQYFVEFRARSALSYGHTFLVHGRLNGKGEVGELSARNVAGFHPAGDGPELWSVGHLVPVPAETGPSDGDLEEEYVTARYRVLLSEDQYKKVAAHIKEKQASPRPWHAALYNCNAWVGDVARFAGLRAPSNHLLFPADYINEIQRLNTGQQVVSTSESPTVTTDSPER